ncbi:MAG TPA: hypothetical protein VMJ32_13130 [Pirellulales bacterium]|nr:hypothetical protein [Pirellulales bacterium]
MTLSGASGDSGATGRIDVQTADCDGVPAWFTGPRVNWTAGQTATAYARIGRANQPIRVRLTPLDEQGEHPAKMLPEVADGVVPEALPATNELIVEVGASIGLPETFQRLNQNDPERTAVVTIDQRQALPEQWYGYDGVDMLVIAGAPAVDKSLLDAAALDALEKWVRQGGKLLVSCGEGAQGVLGQGAPLQRFAPGELAGVINLPAARFGPLENYAAAEQRLEGASIRVSQWRNIRPGSRIELSGGTRSEDLPLVIRWPLGFGEVIFVSLDLHQPPFTDWPSRGKFLERLLGRSTFPGNQTGQTHAINQGKQLGYVDLSGQLRGALDQFAGVQLVPFWAVAMLALAYVGFLFPMNYLIVNRWLRRQSLAWIVFPTTVIVFCLGAYTLANYAKSNVRHVNQVDLLDVDLASGSTRGTTWFNVFSPENAVYDLRVQPAWNQANADADATQNASEKEGATPALLSWFGLAGTGLGGMNSATVNPPLFDEPYTIDVSAGTISKAPLAAWSSKSFVARWEAAGGQLEASLTAAPDHRLRGTVVHHLPAELRDGVLLFDRWAYPLGTLTPGKSVALESLEPQTMDTYLTKRRTVDAREEVPTYDRTSFDVPRIIEVMMFHEAAGGANYTGLLHRYQRFVDLTNQLKFGRAILVGRGPDGAVVQIDGQPVADDAANRHTSMYRFVLPVKSPD